MNNVHHQLSFEFVPLNYCYIYNDNGNDKWIITIFIYNNNDNDNMAINEYDKT